MLFITPQGGNFDVFVGRFFLFRFQNLFIYLCFGLNAVLFSKNCNTIIRKPIVSYQICIFFTIFVIPAFLCKMPTPIMFFQICTNSFTWLFTKVQLYFFDFWKYTFSVSVVSSFSLSVPIIYTPDSMTYSSVRALIISNSSLKSELSNFLLYSKNFS